MTSGITGVAFFLNYGESTMAFLKMARVNQLPDELDPDTLYFVASPDGVHFNLFATGTDNTAVGTATNTDTVQTTVSLGLLAEAP
jgi:hypothetical protein